MTLTKHWLYNKDEDIVTSNLKGLLHSNPSLGYIEGERVLYNLNSDTSAKVTLISGGGAGHEPLHGGFVGENLLDAAVSGAIFASPSTKQIMSAIKAKSNKEKGTLVIVKNYTGDFLHFGLVVERAKSEGYKIDIIPVADDVAVGRHQNAMVGRRGLAGTALIHKILGAVSNQLKAELGTIVELGHLVNANLVTLSASLDRTSVPGREEDDLEFTKHDEIEIGLGIHNEPGHKVSPIPNIDTLIKDMFDKLVSSKDKDRHYVDFDLKNDEYVLVINNMGGSSSLELYAVAHHVVLNLPFDKRPKRVFISDFTTSLNAPGFSVTLLNLSNIEKQNKEWLHLKILQYLDLPTDAPGWKPKSYAPEEWDRTPQVINSPMEKHQKLTSKLKVSQQSFERSLRNSMKKLLENEPMITQYDTIVGDGDCGETLSRGANGILKALSEDRGFKNSLSDPVATISSITEIVEDSMGGTSGGLYSIFLTALSKYLLQQKQADPESISKAFHGALYDGLFKYTKARVGGRTLVDTLQPFVDSFSQSSDLNEALNSARDGCENTKKLKAKFGRASYVEESNFKEGEIPDPGAFGLLSIIEGFLEGPSK